MPSHNTETIIELQGVSASYGQHEVLHNVSLTVPRTGLLGIIGPNGGGKTTLLRLMLGLLRPSEGSIRYFRNGSQCNRLRIGYLPQQNTGDLRFPVTVLDVVLSGWLSRKPGLTAYSATTRNRAMQLLADMDAQDIARRPFSDLSGGQRQRVLLARALMPEPEVLFLDEPTTYFDTQAAQWMLERLDRLRTECSIIMVSHDLDDLSPDTAAVAHVDRTLRHFPMREWSADQLRTLLPQTHCVH